MVLFLADVHLGRHATHTDRATERDLVAFLRAHERDVERLFLVGDVFDYYIEYRHAVPKGFARLQGLLAEWSDAGIEIAYTVGNHDPWHVGYFEEELGVRVVAEHLYEKLYNRVTYVSHGDRETAGAARRILDAALRHPVPVWVYKSLVPADLGIQLARYFSRWSGSRAPEVRPKVIRAQRQAARRVLSSGAADLVVMAHTHQAEHVRWPEGEYLNTGCWYRNRTFIRMDAEGPTLCRWDGRTAVSYAPESAAVSR